MPKSQPAKANAFGDRLNSNAFFFWIIAILCLFFSHLRGFYWLFAPVNLFTTMVHEMGHALVCLATGGQVRGLTIVADGAGHGGLTFCIGGNSFLYAQAGYLGAAIFGCLLIWLAQFPRLSRFVLVGMGLVIGGASFLLVPGAIFQQGHILQGLNSIGWSLAMACILIFAGVKLRAGIANLLLLFLAVETALNSLTCIGDLISASINPGMTAFSDATNMAMITHVPAIFWSLFWGLVSMLLLWWTLGKTYGKSIAFGRKS